MPDPITDAEIQKVLELAEKATPGEWELHDSCSWRRIGTRDRDGGVICPTIASDGHPDLMAKEVDLKFVVAAHPAFVTRLLTELLSLRKTSHSVSQCCPESERLAKRVEELEAIVAKLPRTADGKPITPGMNLWVQCIPEENVFPDDIAMIRAWMDCEEVDARTVAFTECYSTREAAAESLAARGAGR